MIRTLEQPLNPADLSRAQIAAIKKLFGLGVLTPLWHSTQRRMSETFRATKSKEAMAFASRQIGKTFWGLSEAIEVLLKFPKSRILYYAPTKDKLADIVNDTLEPMMQWAPEGLIQRKKAAGRWRVGKSELRLCVLERAHVNRNRGTNAKVPAGELGIVIEEGGFVCSDDFKYAWESVIDAQRLRYKPRVLIITTPSEDENHYIHKVILPKLRELNAVAEYTIYDNPFLTDEDIEEIKGRITEETWLREYMAKIFRSSQSLAVPEFDLRHIAKLEIPIHAHCVTGIDFGGSLDPHGIIRFYYDPKLKKLCVYRAKRVPINTSIDEIKDETLTLEEHSPIGDSLRVADAAGQVSIELHKLVFGHITPDKSPGSFQAYLQALRVAFKNDEILVDESLSDLIDELSAGKLNSLRKDFARSGGHHCDLIAALMYAYRYRITTDATPHAHGLSRDTHHIPPAPENSLLNLTFTGSYYK